MTAENKVLFAQDTYVAIFLFQLDMCDAAHITGSGVIGVIFILFHFRELLLLVLEKTSIHNNFLSKVQLLPTLCERLEHKNIRKSSLKNVSTKILYQIFKRFLEGVWQEINSE